MAKRGLCFSWSHCLCLHCFRRLTLHYADTHTNKRIFVCNFSYFWDAYTYTCLWFFRFCKMTDFATISHFNLHTFMTLCWKFHACNHKCTIVHFLTANKMDYNAWLAVCMCSAEKPSAIFRLRASVIVRIRVRVSVRVRLRWWTEK